MEKKICWYRVLKNISYILFPILLTILIILIFCLTYPLERNAIKNGTNYFETNTFAENYAMEIFSVLNSINVLESNREYGYYYVHTEEVNNDSTVEEINYDTQYYENNVQWLVIDNDTKKAYTNLQYSIETSSIEKIQNIIMQNEKYWNYQEGNIETSVEKLSEENIEYIESGLRQDSLSVIENNRRI